MSALYMIISAAFIILCVKLGLLRASDNVAGAMQWSPKLRGQVTGYATSVPDSFVWSPQDSPASGTRDFGILPVPTSSISV